MKNLTIVGIDLAGAAHRPTGMCMLSGSRVSTKVLHSDDEILEIVNRAHPDLVAIDAPLTLPPGRKSIHERNDSHYRLCDLQLREKKIPFFPVTLGPMRALTERGIRLRNMLEDEGFRVIEIYPGGAQDLWGIPRAKKSLTGLRQGLVRLGLKGLRKNCTADELDAATGALTGLLFLEGKAEIYGDLSSGAIIMPRRPKKRTKPLDASRSQITCRIKPKLPIGNYR